MLKLVFNILNFTLFLSVVGYIFKTYALKAIREHIYRRQEFQKKLITDRATLQATMVTLDQELDNQENLYQDLKVKVSVWKIQTAQMNEHKQKDQQHAFEQAAKRRQQQIIYWQKSNLLKHMVPLALQEAQEELQAQFKDPKRAHNYNQRILDDIASGA